MISRRRRCVAAVLGGPGRDPQTSSSREQCSSINSSSRWAGSKMSKADERKQIKDTSGTAFRKIDVDQYSENNFKEEDPDGGVTGPTGPDESEIQSLLSQYPFLNQICSTAPFFFSISLSNIAVFLNYLTRAKMPRRLFTCSNRRHWVAKISRLR